MLKKKNIKNQDQSTDKKQYHCFCNKKYNSYAGFYLHLKSKHHQAFSKYKNMKISRLLILARDQNDNQIFKLKEPDSNKNEEQNRQVHHSQKKTQKNVKQQILPIRAQFQPKAFDLDQYWSSMGKYLNPNQINTYFPLMPIQQPLQYSSNPQMMNYQTNGFYFPIQGFNNIYGNNNVNSNPYQQNYDLTYQFHDFITNKKQNSQAQKDGLIENLIFVNQNAQKFQKEYENNKQNNAQDVVNLNNQNQTYQCKTNLQKLNHSQNNQQS